MATGPLAPPRTRSIFLAVAILLPSILLGLLPQSATARLQQVLLENEVLEVGQSLYNARRDYLLVMEGHCNLALYGHGQLVWETGTGGQGTQCRTEFRREGGEPYLVVTSASNDIWRQPNQLENTDYVLVVQPDRNVVIYTTAAWDSNTNRKDVRHAAGDQILIATGTLEPGQYLLDAEHNYKFIMQEDCNLVLYDGQQPIWASQTQDKGNRCRASLNRSGNLVIADENGKQVWKSENNSPPLPSNRALLLQPDLNLVVYTHPAWSTGTSIHNHRAADLGWMAAGRKSRIHMVTNKQQAV